MNTRGIEFLSALSIFEHFSLVNSPNFNRLVTVVENAVTWGKLGVKFKKTFKVKKSLNPYKNLRISSLSLKQG